MKLSEKLTELDILDLLNEYNSELRKLSFKAEQVKERIANLEEALREIKGKGGAVPSAALEGREETAAAPAAKPKERKRKPYPLSDWDKAIFESLREEKKALISADILEKLGKKAKEKGIFKSDDDTRVKLNQHLVKLANRRGDLVKVKHKGRGFAYALPEWVDEKGKLKKEYQK